MVKKMRVVRVFWGLKNEPVFLGNLTIFDTDTADQIIKEAKKLAKHAKLYEDQVWME